MFLLKKLMFFEYYCFQMHSTDLTGLTSDQNKYTNNAGRFRSEISISNSNPTNVENNLLSFQSGQHQFDSNLLNQMEIYLDKKTTTKSLFTKESLEFANSFPDKWSESNYLKNTLKCYKSWQNLHQTNETNCDYLLNVKNKSNNARNNQFKNQKCSEDYLLFDYNPLFYGSNFYSNQSNSLKHNTTPCHLENPERETRWYFKYFLGKCKLF